MQRTFKKFISAFLITIVILFISFFVFTKNSRNKLETLLTGVDIPTLNIKDGRITKAMDEKQKQKTERLAAFYQWTKEDPLFTSPDLDAKKLTTSIEVLTKEETEILLLLNEKSHFYPVDFLARFAQTARLTQEFLQHPTTKRAQKLIETQKKTAIAYRQEATALASALEGGKTVYESVTFVNIRSGSKIIINDLKKIATNKDALLLEIEKRETCLNSGLCQRPALAFLKPKKAATAYNDPERIYNPSLVYNSKDKTIDDIRGIYRQTTPCFGLDEDLKALDHFFYLKDVKNQRFYQLSLTYPEIELVDEIYFRKLPDKSNIPGEDELRKSGIPYIHQSPTNPYMCTNLDYYVHIVTLDNFLETKKPIFSNNLKTNSSIKEFLKEARTVEENFFSMKYPSYQELNQLADYYAYAYRLLTQDGGNNQTTNELLDRSLIIKRSLSNFHLVINYLTRSIHSFRMWVVLNPKQEMPFFYTFRNYYSLTYLPFSSSIYRLDKAPQYVEKKRVLGGVGFGGGFITYEQAKEKYSEKEISKWFNHNSDFIEKALKERGIIE